MKRIALFLLLVIGPMMFREDFDQGTGNGCSAGFLRSADAFDKVVVKEKQVVVVQPFAVPVGVPVAPYATYAYQTNPQVQAEWAGPPPSAMDLFAQALLPAIEKQLQKRGGLQAMTRPQTEFDASCVKCHSKAQLAADQPRFTDLESLNCEARLKCIEAIVKGEMPKNGKISPDKRGKLIEELSAQPKPQAAADPSVPPPPPEQ